MIDPNAPDYESRMDQMGMQVIGIAASSSVLDHEACDHMIRWDSNYALGNGDTHVLPAELIEVMKACYWLKLKAMEWWAAEDEAKNRREATEKAIAAIVKRQHPKGLVDKTIDERTEQEDASKET